VNRREVGAPDHVLLDCLLLLTERASTTGKSRLPPQRAERSVPRIAAITAPSPKSLQRKFIKYHYLLRKNPSMLLKAGDEIEVEPSAW